MISVSTISVKSELLLVFLAKIQPTGSMFFYVLMKYIFMFTNRTLLLESKANQLIIYF